MGGGIQKGLKKSLVGRLRRVVSKKSKKIVGDVRFVGRIGFSSGVAFSFLGCMAHPQ